MEKGRRDTVLLTVIAIATLLVAIVGATFAFFTARLTDQNSTSVLTIRSSEGGTITLTGTGLITVNNIYPKSGAWVQKPFKVVYSNANGNVDAKYKLSLVYSNSFGSNGNSTNNATGAASGEIRYALTQTSGYCPDPSKTTSTACTTGWDGRTNNTNEVLIAEETGYFRYTGSAVTTEPLGTGEGGNSAVFPKLANATATGVSTRQVHSYLLTIDYPDTGANQNYTNRDNATVNGGTNHDQQLTVYIKIDEDFNSAA